MKTIEERARWWVSGQMPLGSTRDLKKGYIAGATEQKEIDEDHFLDARKMILDKACSWLKAHHQDLDYINTDGDLFDLSLVEDFRKAMEEE